MWGEQENDRRNHEGIFGKKKNQIEIFNIAFKKKAKLFYDHFQDQESVENIKDLLLKYCKREKGQVFVSVELVESEEEDFLSKADIREKERQEIVEARREKFLNDPLILFYFHLIFFLVHH